MVTYKIWDNCSHCSPIFVCILTSVSSA